MRLAQDIYEESGVLLLSAGTEVETRFLERLSERHIHTVVLQTRQDAERLQNVCTEKMDRLCESLPSESAAACLEKGTAPPAQLSVSGLTSEAEAGLEKHASASSEVAEVGESLARGKGVCASEVNSIISDFTNMIALDKDLLATVMAMQVPQDEYLFDHCVNTAVLSISLGAELGLNPEQIVELGAGALLADVGMLRVPETIRLAPRQLSSDERSEIERHPCHTLDCLTGVEGIPVEVSLVGYQVHERLDGSGYPRGRSGFFLHEYAKISAVADTYAALTRPRPHRPAMVPYAAVETILDDCAKGRFEPAKVRAFLDSVGLFPIRSLVELNNGTKAMVIRTNRGLHTRPVVEELAEDGKPAGRVVNLAIEAGLEVVRALDPSEVTAVCVTDRDRLSRQR